MKKKIQTLPSIFFFLVLSIFFYLLIIERNPSEIPSNLLNKKVPIFEANFLFKNKKFISSNEFNNEITLVNFLQHGVNLVETNIYILNVLQMKKVLK